MRSFNCILVANRGEIAARVIRTAKSLGYRTVAIYSDADSDAPYVRLADDAAAIGPAPARDSYLDIDRVVRAAQQLGADAIHPGYGFLAENAAFVRACEAAGLTFIGPRADAVALMGNKAAAKQRMREAGVPCVPGYEGAEQSDAAMMEAARRIGFPLMVKAAAGGGGRGMRLVARVDELPVALEAARLEALNAFGSDELILEKAIIWPRHVEVQVFADMHGNVIHLGERDCSVQRRHQKVVEEAPCPVMTTELRARMGQAAVEAARSIGYRGAGTIEFLLDEAEEFYFLEMNTRLQVEHAVTEMVTGLDLVALQIRVAEGLPLGCAQTDVTLRGHAIEARLYAEDPAQGFMPASGQIDLWHPAQADGLRIDAGIATGSDISPFYDPMIAKLIAWGETRQMARRRLIEALNNTAVFGPTTNRDFLIKVLSHPRFARGEATTAFIEEAIADGELANPAPTFLQAAIAAALQLVIERDRALEMSVNVCPELLDWSSGDSLLTRYVYKTDEEEINLTVTPLNAGRYQVRSGAEQVCIELIGRDGAEARLAVDGRRQSVLYSAPSPGVLDLAIDGRTLRFRNHIGFPAAANRNEAGGRVVAPMHGSLLHLLVAPGDHVSIGTRLLILEAMKMQHEIRAEVEGVVREVFANPGSQVAAHDPLLEIDTTMPTGAVATERNAG